MSIIAHFGYKGSSKSGNYMHAGRIGKVGGSAPQSFKYPYEPRKELPPDKITIAGKTGAQWKQQQQAISASGNDNLLNELANSNLKKADVEDFLKRLNVHRSMVLDETLKVSQHYRLSGTEQLELVNNVLGHDVDKYTAKTAIP